MTISDQQWEQIEPLLPQQTFRKGGRPRANDRRTLEGILWVIQNGSQWAHLPKKYGAYVTCWRRFNEWQEQGVWEQVWMAYLKSLKKDDELQWVLSFLKGHFIPQKKSNGVS
jgi:transposase